MEMEVGQDSDGRYVAENLRLDNRIGQTRKRFFDSWAGSPRTGRALRDALVDYQRQRVAGTREPDFLDPSLNGHNFAAGAGSVSAPLPAERQLCTVMSLNAKLRVLARARLTSGIFPDLTPEIVSAPSDDALSKWVDRQIRYANSENRLDELIVLILGSLNQNRKNRPHHPIWATSWSRMKPLLSLGPERWTEAVGVARATAGQYLMVLKYSVPEAGTLVRPTQLDAGYNAAHYPSPLVVPCSAGGLALDLCRQSVSSFAPEWIHQEIDWQLEHWTSAKRLLVKTERNVPADLPRTRPRHRRLLSTIYGS